MKKFLLVTIFVVNILNAGELAPELKNFLESNGIDTQTGTEKHSAQQSNNSEYGVDLSAYAPQKEQPNSIKNNGSESDQANYRNQQSGYNVGDN